MKEPLLIDSNLIDSSDEDPVQEPGRPSSDAMVLAICASVLFTFSTVAGAIGQLERSFAQLPHNNFQLRGHTLKSSFPSRSVSWAVDRFGRRPTFLVSAAWLLTGQAHLVQ